MRLNILSSIIFGDLKVWHFNSNDTNELAELVKSNSSVPNSEAELVSQIKNLLKQFPALENQVIKNGSNAVSNELAYVTKNPPQNFSIASRFYQLLIEKEVVRIYNDFFEVSKSWSNPIDYNYRTNKFLNSVKTLFIQTFEELTVRDINEKLTVFVLKFLTHKLLSLYFSIQDCKNGVLEKPITIQDLFFFEFEKEVPPDYELIKIEPKQIQTISTIKYPSVEKFNFGFKGDKQKLSQAISNLTFRFDLLNESVTSQETLLNVLTSKSLKENKVPVQLDCKTTVFQIIVEMLSKYFSNLTHTNIGKSGLFLSKKNKKPISGNLLDVSKHKGKVSKDVSLEIQSIIDNIGN